MAKRVKHVFGKCDDIVHLWAHQQIDWARGGNSSFEGPDFKSYSTVIATITETRDGETAYLVTDHKYSVTTSQHQWAVRSAVPNKSMMFVVPADRPRGYWSGTYRSVSANHADNFYMMVDERVVSPLKEAGEAREPKRSRLILAAYDALPEIRRYFDTFDCSGGPHETDAGLVAQTMPDFPMLYAKYIGGAKMTDYFASTPTARDEFVAGFPAMIEEIRAKYEVGSIRRREAGNRAAQTRHDNRNRRWEAQHARHRGMTVEQYREAVAAEREAVAAERAEEERVRLMNREERIAAWLGGSAVPSHQLHGYGGPNELPTMLRIKGDTVETSRGATFPVSHAVRGLALVRSVMARGEEWKRNGHTCHLGHYQIDRITAEGTVFAGCHEVPWPSIERILPALEQVEVSDDSN